MYADTRSAADAAIQALPRPAVAELSYVCGADQLPALLIPEEKSQATQAGSQGELDLLDQPLALIS